MNRPDEIVEPALGYERWERVLPDTVYFVRCPQDDTVLLALDVKMQGNYIRWFDTVKERMMRVAGLNEIGHDHLTFTRRDGGGPSDQPASYAMAPLTLDLFERHVRHQVRGIPEPLTQAAMIAAIMATRSQAF